MAIGFVQLPAFRAPTGIDFSPLNEAFDTIGETRRRNRLLEEAKELGASLQPTQGQAPASYTAQPVNRLMSPAQSSAAAAGRELPSASGSPYSNAISSIESGGRYDEVGPVTRAGDRAYGKYQVMGTNVGPWTREILGREMTPQQFLSDQDAQEKVFSGKFGQYVQKTGNPQDAASMWFTGRPLAEGANRRDILGTTGAEYVRRFDAAMGRGQPQTATAPQAAPARSGMNYDAGIRTALQQGNVALATQLQNAKQEEENLTYTRGRQATQDAQAAESHALTTQGQRDELQKTFVTRVASLAQNIASDPDPASRTAKWNRLVSADPRFAASLRQAGIDPSDVNAGTAALIAEARGLTPAKPPVEVNGRLVQQQSDGSWKSVYDSPPKPAQLMAGDRKEVYESDESVRAGTQALSTLDHALELNGKAYSGLAPSTRAWISSQFGGQGGADTRELENITTRLALEQLKLTFGGQPTEGERAILLQVQGSLSETPEVRKRIFETAKQAVERRVAFNREQGQAIRSGGYFTPGYDPNAAAAGVRAPAQAAPQTTPDQNLPTVNTPEEADALPPGTRFRTPDGRIKTRP